jgi:2-C-methyl-D-erythritol 4-phosphate cytidylyltransferase
LIKAGRVSAIIVAAGEGKRLGSETPKPFLELGDKTILETTVERFLRADLVDELVIVLSRIGLDLIKNGRELVGVSKFVEGGRERPQSVRKGFAAIDPAAEIVVVHDGVRPLVTPDLIEQVVLKAGETGAAITGVPAIDTLKEISDNGTVSRTIDRKKIVQVQTPQAFRCDLLREVYEGAELDGDEVTDEAVLFERAGLPVALVAGAPDNIKITTESDLKLAKLHLETEESEL